jgi:DNA-binding NarL/FixJ family response regulator
MAPGTVSRHTLEWAGVGFARKPGAVGTLAGTFAGKLTERSTGTSGGTALHTPLRVLVVDDHRTVTDLLEIGIDREDDLACVGMAHNAATAMLEVDRLEPDVVVMDVQLGDDDGLTVTRQILERRPGTRVVVLTAHPDARIVSRAAEAGASWLLAKDGSLPDLLHAVRASVSGGFVVQPTLLKLLLRPEQKEPAAVAPTLSPREHEVLAMLGRGLNTRGIADRLGISLHTCRSYVKSLMSKLDAHSQLEAVVIANRAGLIDADAS